MDEVTYQESRAAEAPPPPDARPPRLSSVERIRRAELAIATVARDQVALRDLFDRLLERIEELEHELGRRRWRGRRG